MWTVVRVEEELWTAVHVEEMFAWMELRVEEVLRRNSPPAIQNHFSTASILQYTQVRIGDSLGVLVRGKDFYDNKSTTIYVSFEFTVPSLWTTSNTVFKKETEPI